MKRFKLFFAAALVAGAASAQTPDAVIADVKRSWTGLKANLQKAAEDMPEDGYAFVPGQGSRNFGAWVGHVADAQANMCGTVMGAPKQLNAERGKTTKADLVAALKESIEVCDAAMNTVTPANWLEPKQSFGGATPTISLLYGMYGHSQECYGSMAVYLRSKSLVPPSTAGRGGGAGKGKGKQ
jgi:hypothetical protein